MKRFKGLFLIAGFLLLAVSGIKADPNTDSIKDDIFTAIRSVDYTSINILLSDATNIDTVDQDGNTPLMIASTVGNQRIVNIVLSHEPEVNMKNDQGKTALMIAAEAGLFDVVKALVNHGAKVSMRDNNGNTALTLASKFGHQKIVTYFNDIRTQHTSAK